MLPNEVSQVNTSNYDDNNDSRCIPTDHNKYQQKVFRMFM